MAGPGALSPRWSDREGRHRRRSTAGGRGFVAGAPRIALLLGMSDPSRSAFPLCPQGCSCSSWEALSPSSHRDHFSLPEDPAGAAEGSAVPVPRGGGQACSHSAFLEWFWHKSFMISQCCPGTALPSVPGNISPLQNWHREKKLTPAAGGCRQGNNLRLERPFRCLKIPVNTGKARQKLLPELTLFGK